MKNSEYWRKRSEILEESVHTAAGKLAADIERQFNLAQKTLDEAIEQWYGRFASNNQISLSEARQWLIGKDLAEFKWDVSEYITRGRENAVSGKWLKELENASARFHISKLEALKIRQQNIFETLYGKFEQKSRSLFGDVFYESYYKTIFELQKGFNIGFDVAKLDPKQIENVLSKPWTLDGGIFSDKIWKDKQKLIDEVQTRLTQNIMLGKSSSDAITAIAKRFDVSKSNAGRFIHTESAYFSNEAQRRAYQKLEVDEVEVIGTLDSKTCAICGGFDGKHFPMSQWEIGVTAPIYHPNCRCCTAPYFDDNFGGRAARNADGKTYYVDSGMKYPEWKERFVKSPQK